MTDFNQIKFNTSKCYVPFVCGSIKQLAATFFEGTICEGLLTLGHSFSPSATDDECDLCQMLVKIADDFITSNSTEEEIVKGLLDICSILPGDLKSQVSTP